MWKDTVFILIKPFSWYRIRLRSMIKQFNESNDYIITARQLFNESLRSLRYRLKFLPKSKKLRWPTIVQIATIFSDQRHQNETIAPNPDDNNQVSILYTGWKWQKCTLFDSIYFREVKHKPIDYSPSDRIKTARQIGERKILKVLNPTGSRNRQTIYSLPRFLALLILFQKFFKTLKYNSHNLLIMPFVSTNNNHANEKTTCLLIFRSHVSCLLWETFLWSMIVLLSRFLP